MRRAWGLVVVALAIGIAGRSARGQDVLYQQSSVVDPAVGEQFLITPTDTRVVGLDGLGAAPPGSPVVGGVGGTVGGYGLSNSGHVAVGFTYLAPLWSFRDFQLAAPKQFAALFPVFGDTGRVDTQFAYAPRVNLDYYVADYDFAVSTSGTFINLSGRVDRQATSSLGLSGQLSAHSELTLVSANIVELGRQFAFLDLFPRKNPKHQSVADSVLDLRIGTRYVSLSQNYTGALTGGAGVANITTRDSTQTFRGVGLTLAADWNLPIGMNWVWIFSARQSVLLGDNRRSSSVTVTAVGFAGLAETEFDDRTVLVPATELETGVEWGFDLAERLRNGLAPPRFTARVTAVGQYWGGLGPLSAGSTQGFRRTDLFLVGGYVQAGFRF
jgi:hypothetical protein